LTTQLSTEGEAQLARVAQVTGGTIVRAEHGDTGIDQVARALKKMMREELSEKVETVYAEEYAWPLGLAVVLLLAEGFLGEAPRRDGTTPPAGRRNDARTSPRSTTPPSADVPSARPKRGRNDARNRPARGRKDKKEATP